MRESDRGESLLRLLPPIRRARLWRLYAEDGRRFLDLWMDGGSSLLGAKGRGLGTRAKAALDMGLMRPLPSVWERRLAKALAAAYPGYSAALFYRNRERALLALAAALGKGVEALAILDSALRETDRRIGPEAADALVLRPFGEHLPATVSGGAPRFALPLVPCPSALAPGILLVRDARDAASLAGEAVPPLSLACAAASLGELELFSRIYGEELWRRSDRRLGAFFERSGPYLYPRCGDAAYPEFFREALAAGILVSPLRELPSMVPGDFDDGELAALGRARGTAAPGTAPPTRQTAAPAGPPTESDRE